MAVRALLRIYGSVQGVNYRWFVQSIAKSLHINGWVKNLPDGSVEVLCEAKTEPAFGEFLRRISPREGLRRVDRIDTLEFSKSAEPEYSSFEILIR